MYPRNAMERAHRAYGDAAVGVPPVVLLVQVHDGMVEKLAEARAAIMEGRIEDRFVATSKVAAVIEALHLALDDERGGEIAQNLGRLYTHFVQRLGALNVHNDPDICDELIDRLSELRTGWSALLEAQTAAPIEVAAVSA
jgi:flagellar secretion chaperone FliS